MAASTSTDAAEKARIKAEHDYVVKEHELKVKEHAAEVKRAAKRNADLKARCGTTCSQS